jgi:hypothetical protein
MLNCMDPATLLAQIEAAISALLTGGASSYSIGSRSVTKIDLADLMNERRMLLTEVERANGSGAFSLAKLGRRR